MYESVPMLLPIVCLWKIYVIIIFIIIIIIIIIIGEGS